MSEMLVRVHDKTNADFYLDCMCSKRGDVISTQRDGWGWGQGELTNPNWRIFSLPSVTLGQIDHLTAPELPVDPLNPSKTLQRYALKFDVDGIATCPSVVGATALTKFKIQQGLNDDTRAVPIISVPLINNDISLLTVVKPPIQDPNVIGGPSNVIG